MPRKNLAGNYCGESNRLTIRLSRADMRTLDELAGAWHSDRSEVLRRALREAGATARTRHRNDLLAMLPTLTLPELRVLAREHRITGRSRMTRARIEEALQDRLQRRT